MKAGDDEKCAIAALQKLLANWPKTLWIHMQSDLLYVMRYDEIDGARIVSANYIVATIPIPVPTWWRR